MHIMKNSGRIAGLALAAHLGIGTARATIITLNGTGDAAGPSSFNAGTNWAGGQVPSSANDHELTGTL